MIPDGATVTYNEVADPKKGDQFDIIFASNILQMADRQHIMGLLGIYWQLLKDRGQLIVVVPSLEWACEQITLHRDPPMMAMVSIYGTDEEPHKCGFTLLYLRHALSEAGYLIQEATSRMYHVRINGVDAQAFTHLAIGVKDGFIGDPGNSIV